VTVGRRSARDPAADGSQLAAEDRLGLQPLTARSVILSLLLGSHPPELPVRALVRTAARFGISEGTTRVALSRLLAEGDVIGTDGRYRLSSRLVARQRRQDEARRPAMRAWRGNWEIAVLRPARLGAAERSQLEAEVAALRLAALRSGVWTRPANLQRPWPDGLLDRVWRFDGRPAHADGTGGRSPAALAASLWDLDGWARRARALLDTLRKATDPGRRFVIAAAVVRHLQLDPLLPPPLLPSGWPGEDLRAAYAGYVAELGRLLRAERARYDSGS
jgi:phenylacetic acid degradation operon negative regulatory protein